MQDSIPRSVSSVYPRVGGGTGEDQREHFTCEGLSPRGRGNLFIDAVDKEGEGSIPAWAGEPAITTTKKTQGAVYPRVGGGTIATAAEASSERGLSPRGRGNLAKENRRSIGSSAVYPRVGGGTHRT